jgi:hypothetical protein
MRRQLGLIVSALGAFFVVLAVLLHFLVPRMAVKFPLNIRTITTARASNVSYFSTIKLKEFHGVTVRATNTVKGVPAQGSSSVAVWRQFLYVYDETNRLPVSWGLSQMAIDRRTGELVNCCGTHFGPKANVHVSGQGPVFPFGTKKQTYPVFNSNVLKALPARYAGEQKIDGLTAYKFVQQVGETRVGTQAVPGALIGEKSTPLVGLGEYYQATNVWWIDPLTGVTISIDQKEHLSLRDSSGVQRLNLFQGELRPLPPGIAKSVRAAKARDFLVTGVSALGPLIAGVFGFILLAVGLALCLVPGRAEEADFTPRRHAVQSG